MVVRAGTAAAKNPWHQLLSEDGVDVVAEAVGEAVVVAEAVAEVVVEAVDVAAEGVGAEAAADAEVDVGEVADADVVKQYLCSSILKNKTNNK